MSLKEPFTLLGLSMKSLLRHEALAISALQELPIELFPPLLKEAFNNRHMKIITEMVAVWPFLCLPVGALMIDSDLAKLQAVLVGVDMLLTQKIHLRRSKLRVLDLRNVHQVFWDVWSGIECGDSSTGTLSKEQTENGLPRDALRWRLKVVTQFYLKGVLDQQQAFLLQWAQQQKGSVQLCCMTLTIYETPVHIIKKVLNTFQPYLIEELRLSVHWTPGELSHFSHCFCQMRNLHKIHLAHICIYTNQAVYTCGDIEKYAARFITQISKLNSLQHLIINDFCFSSEHMKQLFRCLKSPLESLTIRLHKFSPSDLKHLSQCQCLFQLKHLKLIGVSLFNLCPTALQDLLKSVADTLQILQLHNCCIRDPQPSAFLPALSQCLQLTRVNFTDSDISMSVLKDLLQILANLSKLTEEFYPAPIECYDNQGHVLVNKFTNVCSDLLDTIRAKRQTKSIYFATKSCCECIESCVFDGEKTRLCPCLS